MTVSEFNSHFQLLRFFPAFSNYPTLKSIQVFLASVLCLQPDGNVPPSEPETSNRLSCCNLKRWSFPPWNRCKTFILWGGAPQRVRKCCRKHKEQEGSLNIWEWLWNVSYELKTLKEGMYRDLEKWRRPSLKDDRSWRLIEFGILHK